MGSYMGSGVGVGLKHWQQTCIKVIIFHRFYVWKKMYCCSLRTAQTYAGKACLVIKSVSQVRSGLEAHKVRTIIYARDRLGQLWGVFLFRRTGHGNR